MAMEIEMEELIYFLPFLISLVLIVGGVYFLLVYKRKCPSCGKSIRPIWRGCSCVWEASSPITQEPQRKPDFESVTEIRPYSYDDAQFFSEGIVMGTELMLPPIPSAWLLIEERETPEKRYEIKRTVISIGSSEDNDIILKDRTVSRHHAKIRIEGKKYFIYDLASTNGIRVNGRKIAKKWIKEGDSIEMGHIRMAFRTSEIPKYKPSDLLRI